MVGATPTARHGRGLIRSRCQVEEVVGAAIKQAFSPIRQISPKVRFFNNTERPYSLETQRAVTEILFPGAKVWLVSKGS